MTKSFPNSFYHFNTCDTETVSGKTITNDICEWEIESWIDQIKYNIITLGKPHSSISCGNTSVVGLRYGSNIEIYVMKNYYRKTITLDV